MDIISVHQKIKRRKSVQRIITGGTSGIKRLSFSQALTLLVKRPFIWFACFLLFVLILLNSQGLVPQQAQEAVTSEQTVSTLANAPQVSLETAFTPGFFNKEKVEIETKKFLPADFLINSTNDLVNLVGSGAVSILGTEESPGKREKKSIKTNTNKTDGHYVSIPKEVQISCRHLNAGNVITTHFLIDSDLPAANLTFIWDLGDGKKHYGKKCAYSYTAPGNYEAQLTLIDIKGNKVKSNILKIDIPTGADAHTSSTFITVNKIGELFYTEKKITRVDHFLDTNGQPFVLVKEENNQYGYQTTASGFYTLVFEDEGKIATSYLFISPVESIHSDRIDANWYRTQFNTGLSNCGPATVAMGVVWATGKNIEVKDVRKYIGWEGNGATSFENLQSALVHYGVDVHFTKIKSKESIFNIINKKNIAIILFKCGSIPLVKGLPEYDLMGTYYQESVGHYIIIKGYSTDKQYFIVHDPIPSDWSSNGKRYGDGISMLGRNRYYEADKIMNAILTNNILEISRN